MNPIGLAELADRAFLEPGGWSVVMVDESEIVATTEDLRKEFAFLLEDEGLGSVSVFSEGKSGPALVDELAGLGPDNVALLPLPANLHESVSRSLDYGRGRIPGSLRGAIITSDAGVLALAAEAPNFWSWIGPRVWTLDPRAGQLDTEARLASLQEGTGLSNVEVIERAEAGTLAADPIFSEWLVLLGKGDLLGR
ncbi:MAG: hypothetical protein ABJE95_18810 [Byssovorax sp.]